MVGTGTLRARAGFVTDLAPTDAELDRCVRCGLCLPHCPTFRLTGDESASPRGRIMAMVAVAEGIAEVDAVFEDMMDFCLACRACEAVCPGLAPYGRMIEGARVEVAVQRPSAARRLRHLVLGRAIASRWFMRAATTLAAVAARIGALRLLPARLARGASGLRPLPLRPRSAIGTVAEPDGSPVATVGLLAGCVMDPWFADVHEATIAVLVAAGYRVVVPSSQTCCGALAAHDGDAADARRLAARNLAAFADVDLVVADAAGCGAHLRGYGHWVEGGDALAAKVRDVTELVATAIADGRLPTSDVERGPVAVQDPCHLRHAQRIVEEPRALLRAAGYTPVEIDPKGLCCGAAGVYSVVHPETSAELGRRKAGEVEAAGTTIVASANPGCEMQLRAHLGPAYRIAHPVELYRDAVLGRPRTTVTGQTSA